MKRDISIESLMGIGIRKWIIRIFIFGLFSNIKAGSEKVLDNKKKISVEFNFGQFAILAIASKVVANEFNKRGLTNNGKFWPFLFDIYFKDNGERLLNLFFGYRYDNNAVYNGMHEYILMYGSKIYWHSNESSSRQTFFEYKLGISVAHGPYHQHDIVPIDEDNRTDKNQLSENKSDQTYIQIETYKEDYFCFSLATAFEFGYRWFPYKNLAITLSTGPMFIIPLYTKSPLNYSFVGIIIHRVFPILKFGVGFCK